MLSEHCGSSKIILNTTIDLVSQRDGDVLHGCCSQTTWCDVDSPSDRAESTNLRCACSMWCETVVDLDQGHDKRARGYPEPICSRHES